MHSSSPPDTGLPHYAVQLWLLGRPVAIVTDVGLVINTDISCVSVVQRLASLNKIWQHHNFVTEQNNIFHLVKLNTKKLLIKLKK